MRKAEMISTARKSNTANPFIIFDIFEQLATIFKENPDLDASRICNCDESGFPTDQTRGKVIAGKGQRGLKLSFGARENITVLGICSASGVALDPLFIFKGKNIMSSWCGDMALPNTYYGKYNVFVVWGHGFAQYILWKI